MKKLFAALSAALLLFLSFAPANATLTNSNTFTRFQNRELYSALITAASNDTTANAPSNVISNQDGNVQAIEAMVVVTNQTGTSPTVQLQLQGSYDNVNFFVVQTAQGSTAGTTANIQSAATSISTASTTTVVVPLASISFGRNGHLPPYLRLNVVVGGSSTPGWTGVVSAMVERK